MDSTKNIVVTFIVLLGSILFFGLTQTDIVIQSHFYNPLTRQWIVDGNNEVLKFIFYDGIKRLLIIIAALFAIGLIWGWRKSWMSLYRRGFMIVILSSILVPLMVGSLKALTNMPCPKNIENFGGVYPHTCVWEKYSTQACHFEKQKCWPAGHASGGFALLSLMFLFHQRRNKILAGIVALVVGWSMGGYKMVIGDHFFSHTVITMILAWLIILLVARGVDRWMPQRNTLH